MKPLFIFFRKRRWLIFLTIFADTLAVSLSLGWNVQLRCIIDATLAGASPPREAILWAFATIAALAGITYFGALITSHLCEKTSHDLRMAYGRHLLSLPADQVEKLNVGEALSIAQNEILGVTSYIGDHLFVLISDVLRFLFTVCWLILINPALTAATCLPSLLLLVYVLWSSNVINRTTTKSQDAKEKMNRQADVLLNLFPVIRLFDAASLASTAYSQSVVTWKTQTLRLEGRKSFLMSLSGILSNVPLVVLLLLGGTMAISGTLTIGTLYMFLNLSGNISGVLGNMPGHIAAFCQFSANMSRVSEKVRLQQLLNKEVNCI